MLSRMSVQLKPGQLISIQRSPTTAVPHCYLNAPHHVSIVFFFSSYFYFLGNFFVFVFVHLHYIIIIIIIIIILIRRGPIKYIQHYNFFFVFGSFDLSRMMNFCFLFLLFWSLLTLVAIFFSLIIFFLIASYLIIISLLFHC